MSGVLKQVSHDLSNAIKLGGFTRAQVLWFATFGYVFQW